MTTPQRIHLLVRLEKPVGGATHRAACQWAASQPGRQIRGSERLEDVTCLRCRSVARVAPPTTAIEPELLPPEDASLTRSNDGTDFLTAQDHARVRQLLEARLSPATRAAYSSDLACFWRWAGLALGLTECYPVPLGVVVRFILDSLDGVPPELDSALVAHGAKSRSGAHKLTTVERRLVAISVAHQVLGAEPNPVRSPEISQILKAARRRASDRGEVKDKKCALTRERLAALLRTCGDDLHGIRDRALLMFGFSSGGRRRSEIVAARVEDMEQINDGGAIGYLYHLRRSKTDQEGRGATLPVLGVAAVALRAWIQAAGIERGPIFRRIDRHLNISSDALKAESVRHIVKRRARLAGFDPATFGAHSLRSGYITTASRSGVSLRDIMALTQHRTLSVLLGYVEEGDVLSNRGSRLMG